MIFGGGVGGATCGGGGPDKAAETIGYYLYVQAFSFFHAGYAAAISVVLFLIILAITGLQVGVFSRRVFYPRPPAARSARPDTSLSFSGSSPLLPFSPSPFSGCPCVCAG